MSLISKLFCYLFKDQRKKIINICLSFVKKMQEIIEEQGLTEKSNLFEIFFFIMIIVMRRYFRKLNKTIAEYQVDLFIKEIFNYIWLTHIDKSREVATKMFDMSNYVLMENMTVDNIFHIFTNKLTERTELYGYSTILDINDKSYKETIKTFIDLTFAYKLNDSQRELLTLPLSKGIISNTIELVEKTI